MYKVLQIMHEHAFTGHNNVSKYIQSSKMQELIRRIHLRKYSIACACLLSSQKLLCLRYRNLVFLQCISYLFHKHHFFALILLRFKFVIQELIVFLKKSVDQHYIFI